MLEEYLGAYSKNDFKELGLFEKFKTPIDSIKISFRNGRMYTE